MEAKSGSVWTDPKLRSGAKAVALALSLVFLPIWAGAIFGFIIYFFPIAFSFEFLGSFAAFMILAFLLKASSSAVLFAVLSTILFFLLLGIKNVLFLRRKEAFIIFLSLIGILSIYGFFAGFIPLPVVGLLILLSFKDLLRSFTGFPGRHVFLSAVLGLSSIEVLYAVSSLNLSLSASVISSTLILFPLSSAFFFHLKGTLFRPKIISRISSIVGIGILIIFASIFGR